MRSLLLVAFSVSGSLVTAQFPAVGKPAPSFTAKDEAGKDVQVGGKSKTWTVLAFYPKALTGG